MQVLVTKTGEPGFVKCLHSPEAPARGTQTEVWRVLGLVPDRHRERPHAPWGHWFWGLTVDIRWGTPPYRLESSARSSP